MPAGEVETRVLPLSGVDPDAPFDDLSAIAELVDDARIVGLGESAHLVHEFYLARHRILRFLVEELGFSAFVMESGWSEGMAVHDWVRGDDGDIDGLLRTGFTYGLGACREMRDQLCWMRTHNSRGDRKVDFYGMDMLSNLSTPEPGLRHVW